MASISFGDHNVGIQAGVNNGSLTTETNHLTERSEMYNTQGGAIFTSNISAIRDVNIRINPSTTPSVIVKEQFIPNSNLSKSTEHINTIRPLAHSLYKSLFSSSELFSQIRNELGLLVSVLNATEEHTRKVHTDNEQLPELKDALSKCHSALRDLSRLKEHFDSVGPQTQVTWERMGWAEDELVDIRSKFTLYINVLNVLNTNMIRSSHENVERMLSAFISEIRSGKRESSAMSSLSAGSLSTDEKEEWRQLRKELQSIGVTPDIFSRNREFILTTLCALSQDENECRIKFATIDEEKSSPGTPREAGDCSSRTGTKDGMAPLPQIRDDDPPDPATQLHSSFNKALAGKPINPTMYEGYTFFKADPIPGQKATWIRAERVRLYLTQGEFFKMARKRAHKKSAARQYQDLSDIRRAHVDQLIHEQRTSDSSVEWSCVYAKERDRLVKDRSRLRDKDYYETVSMDVILMKMPPNTMHYPRTPMGHLVDLGKPFRLEENEAQSSVTWSFSMMDSPGYQSEQALVPGQVIRPGYVVQGPLPRDLNNESQRFPDSHGTDSDLTLGDRSNKRARLLF